MYICGIDHNNSMEDGQRSQVGNHRQAIDVVTLDRFVQLEPDGTPSWYPMTRERTEPGSLRYMIMPDARAVELGHHVSHRDCEQKHKRAMLGAEMIATQFKTDLRVIDVLGDGGCGYYVKGLFQSSLEPTAFGTVGVYPAMAYCEELMDPTYDLIVLCITDGVITVRAIGYNSHALATATNKHWSRTRRKAIAVLQSNHFFLVAPKPTVQLPVDYQGDVLCWQPDQFHALMRNCGNEVQFEYPSPEEAENVVDKISRELVYREYEYVRCDTGLEIANKYYACDQNCDISPENLKQLCVIRDQAQDAGVALAVARSEVEQERQHKQTGAVRELYASMAEF